MMGNHRSVATILSGGSSPDPRASLLQWDSEATYANTFPHASGDGIPEVVARMQTDPEWSALLNHPYLAESVDPTAAILIVVRDQEDQWGLGSLTRGAVALHKASSEEFGLSLPAEISEWWDLEWGEESQSEGDFRVAVSRVYLRHVYALTQEDLRQRGITHVRLFRGMTTTTPQQFPELHWQGQAQRVHLKARPLSSFSIHSIEAESFADMIQPRKVSKIMIGMDVPREQILGIGGVTGLGSYYESEWVVLDHASTTARVISLPGHHVWMEGESGDLLTHWLDEDRSRVESHRTSPASD